MQHNGRLTARNRRPLNDIEMTPRNANDFTDDLDHHQTAPDSSSMRKQVSNTDHLKPKKRNNSSPHKLGKERVNSGSMLSRGGNFPF